MTHPSPLALTATAAPPRAERRDLIRVWDPLVRLFHWSLAAAVLTAFLTEDEVLGLHTAAGYTVLGLIGFRVLWGLIGPSHARWSDFVRGPRATLTYLKDAIRGRAARHLGHNPAGAAMVVALLLGLTATALSGMAVLGASELSGPLAPYLQGISPQAAHRLEDFHEVVANLTLLLVPLHLLGVALASWQHRENLVRAMIDGLKRRERS
ncbi:MAG: cytochrome b/b6 domain-containing protein [Bdellovibrio bacteriovorus]